MKPRWSRRHPSGRVVYVTFDGLLGAIGFSQVVRVVTALARRGLPYTIVSLERPEHLAESGRVEDLRQQLGEAGVTWRALRYDTSQTKGAAAANLGVVFATLARMSALGGADLLHTRGYHATLVASGVRRATGVPYLFDARGYWIDERRVEGRWFTRPSVYAAAKRLERDLYRKARGVVTLTEIQADDLRSGRVTGEPRGDVEVITTSADFDTFTLRPRAEALLALPAPARARLEGKLVIGLVGSLNGSYRGDDAARVCRAIVDRCHRAHVLVLSEQTGEYASLLTRHGIGEDRFTLAKASPETMPTWLPCIDWGCMILVENFAKRASMPTKLGEFFAAGVRPLHFGCNAEVAEWVRRVGTGLVLESVDDAALLDAARRVDDTPGDGADLIRGRELAAAHFSLGAAVDRYQALVGRLLASPRGEHPFSRPGPSVERSEGGAHPS